MPANAFADVIAPRAFAGMARSYRFYVNQIKKTGALRSRPYFHVHGLPGRRNCRPHQLKPAPADTLFSSPLNAPAMDTLARLPMARW